MEFRIERRCIGGRTGNTIVPTDQDHKQTPASGLQQTDDLLSH